MGGTRYPLLGSKGIVRLIYIMDLTVFQTRLRKLYLQAIGESLIYFY